ncbi:recombinase family protein [uncultured Litoreibacter sp.]|uniref:recombinase family protein n=1 Tax=uncultured Litoreibacter sp. TaxID=1392394 RepID=UPI00260C17E3|nr:recombinase family protein [uncultured Litoreibacter sp.]
MQQYVTYKRVSTEGQGASGLGIAAQERDIALYLDTYSKQPFEIVGEFVEVVSGKSKDRPVLTEAIALAKQTGAELLIAKLDRLSRRVSVISSIMEDPKVNLRVAAMPMADKFQLHIYAALAEQERDFISIRTKAALKEAKAKGVKLGGLRDATGRRNVAIQAEALARAKKVAGLIVPMREAGATLRQIANALNKSGVETARGGKWRANQVSRVLERLATQTSPQVL